MKTTLILFIGLFISLTSYSQSKEIWNKNRICRQIGKSLDHLNMEKETRHLKIKVDKILRFGWGYSFMTSEYAAGRLNIDKEQLWDEQFKEKTNGFYKQVSESESEAEIDKVTIDLGFCARLECAIRNPNTIISKLDSESMLFYLTTKKSGKNGPSGFIYLFFFDDNDNIIRTYKSNWIE